jgi:hypothetical protein
MLFSGLYIVSMLVSLFISSHCLCSARLLFYTAGGLSPYSFACDISRRVPDLQLAVAWSGFIFFQLLVSVSAFGIIAQIGLTKVIFSFLLNRIWLQQNIYTWRRFGIIME